MTTEKTFSRREFGSLSAACLAYAVTGTKPKWDFSVHNSENTAKALLSPGVITARNLITSREIGNIHLGCSSLGNCNAVSAAHQKQLLLLCEILQPGQADIIQSIAVPATAIHNHSFRTLMTTLVFPAGVRVEVTSTSDTIHATGCVIRGDCGSLHIQEEKITVISDGNQREVHFDVCREGTPETNAYAALVHKVLCDAQKRISA